MQEEKAILLQKCLELSELQLTEIQANLNNLNESLTTATKSSAGDKHETSRAMIQLEIEKLSKQLLLHKKSHGVLTQLQNKVSSKKVELGSLVTTKMGNYFIATSLGKVNVNMKDFFVISPIAPIGQAMLGKKEGESFGFGGKQQVIIELK